MSNKIASKNEKSIDSSKKNERGSLHGKTVAKDQSGDAKFTDDGKNKNVTQGQLKSNEQSPQPNVEAKEPSKNLTSKK